MKLLIYHLIFLSPGFLVANSCWNIFGVNKLISTGTGNFFTKVSQEIKLKFTYLQNFQLIDIVFE